MQHETKAFVSWSGGKDSALCLYKMIADENYSVDCLLTSVNETHDRVSMHGVRRELLSAQAASIGIPLRTIELPDQPAMSDYERIMMDRIYALKGEGYTSAIFGDIFLEDLKAYREKTLGAAGIQCIFPLWKHPTATLMEEFLRLGFKAVVVCVDERHLDKTFCGRLIDESFVSDLPANVDICGENGEYHSFVFDGPLFNYPVSFQKGEIVHRTYAAPNSGPAAVDYGFYFCDLFV